MSGDHGAHEHGPPEAGSPRRYALFSVAASLATLVLKFGAFAATGSVGLLSDAVESLVNVSAALLALTALALAYRPADQAHAYGHGKAEYFSAGAEGLLILVAALGIAWAAVSRFLDPAPLSNLGPGLAIAMVAAVINLVTARSMLRAAKRFDSITLEADAKHLLTDVWTSAGLVLGLGVIILAPELRILDPILALIMAANIVRTGISLMRRSASGLMDASLPPEELKAIHDVICEVVGEDVHYHALRTRKSGPRRFIDFHLLLPGATTVKQSHDISAEIEAKLRLIFPNPQVTVHVEPIEDPASHDGWMLGGTCSARGAEVKECPKKTKE